MITVYTDNEGYVYAADEPNCHSHQGRTDVASYDDARRFVWETFDVLIAHGREWIVSEGHPATEEG